ncbi:MAG: ATP-binding protein [Candidatus Thermoplasmatota archaeon]|jgi:hypothetical protein|nr:ATP-binding protein [Candidatus Thermoplasmatota archaeon]
MEQILRRYNPWWEGEYRPPGIVRKDYLTRIDELLGSRRMVLLFGLRRIGKTTIMRQFIAERVAKKGSKNVLFISLDNPVLRNVPLLDVLDTYRSLFGLGREQTVLMVIDEVQTREGFEAELKTIYDMEENVELLAAGSNSLLIKHKTGALVGRYGRVRVDPLSFDEFLLFRGVEVKGSETYLLMNLLEEYLETGGIPEYVLHRDPSYVEDVVEDIIYKDIVPRYGIKDIRKLKDLFHLLCNRSGRRMTNSRIARILELSHETVSSYISHFEESFLVSIIEKDGTPSQRKRSPKKVYIADQGILTIIGNVFEKGPRAENLVYLHLRDLGDVRYIEEQGKEIDFLVNNFRVEVKYRDHITLDDLPGNGLRKNAGLMVITKGRTELEGVKCVTLLELVQGKVYLGSKERTRIGKQFHGFNMFWV